MSSLLVANDLDLMMLEFAVQKLYLPKKSVFDSVIMKKITVMFRMLDSQWTAVNPQRTDYFPYHGSNLEEINFNGGKSVAFAIPTDSLKTMMKGVDIQIHVIKEVSKYFEKNPHLEDQNVGVAFANVDHLFNGIIKDLREREELKEYLNCFHKRQPISRSPQVTGSSFGLIISYICRRSLKETYEIVDENQQRTGATIEIYVRLSYLGKSVITEIEKDQGLRPMFYAQEETNETSPYQFRELDRSELESGCWGNETFSKPVRAEQLVCHCDKWGITDHKSRDKSGEKSGDKKADGALSTVKGTVKGGSDRKSVENVRKGDKKPSNDDSQVKKVTKKMMRPSRISKSADGQARNKTSKEEMSGQKHRITLKDKRAKGDVEDRKTIRILDKNGEKSAIEPKANAGDSAPSKDVTKTLLAQLRRRCRGNVTVGIGDKKKNICQSATLAQQQPLSTCPVALMSPQLCANSSYSSGCYYPRSYACNPPSAPLTHGCFIHV